MLALCESRSQVNQLSRIFDRIPSGFSLIAVNPGAAWEMQKKGLEYLDLDDFQEFPSTKKIEDLLRSQIIWAQNVDRFLQESNPAFSESDFRPARYFLYHIKNTWDTYVQRAEVLDSLTSRINPEKVIYFKNKSDLQFDRNLTAQGSVLADCIPSWSEYHNIYQEPLPGVNGDTFWMPQSALSFSFRDLLRLTTNLLPVSLRNKGSNLYWKMNTPDSPFKSPEVPKTQSAIILRRIYDTNDEMISSLGNYGIQPLSFEGFMCDYSTDSRNFKFKYNLQKTWEEIQSNDWFWQPCGFQKWPLKKFLRHLFKKFWFSIIPELWNYRACSEKNLDEKKPCALLYGAISTTSEIGLVMAARSRKIPIVCYQHGASIGDIENPIWEILDRFYSDYMLVYGTGEEEYLQSRPSYGDFSATPLPVGSARLDRIISSDPRHISHIHRQNYLGKDKKPAILYVPGVYFNNFYRYTYNVINAPFYRARISMAQLFSGMENLHFLYKAFVSNGIDPTPDILKRVCPSCKIINNIPLTEIQWSADLLIHEFPSTAMYEGLLTDKPMIVYVDKNVYRMPEEIKDLLKRRVILAESEDSFVEKTKTFLKDNDFSPIKSPDREFLKNYCTHLDDGQSASRAAAVIARIINNPQLKMEKTKCSFGTYSKDFQSP